MKDMQQNMNYHKHTHTPFALKVITFRSVILKLIWKNITTLVIDSERNFGIRELCQRRRKLLLSR